MTFTLAEIDEALRGQAVVRGIDTVERGHIRIQTDFRYPEGSYVDLFLLANGLFPQERLSDLGNTFSWLADLQIRPWESKKRLQFVEDVVKALDVELVDGALETSVPAPTALPGAISRLGQACLRVADLMYTRRSSLLVPVAEEVEEILVDIGVDYKTDAELAGIYGTMVKVDFLVSTPRNPTAILTWASTNPSQGHQIGNEIFRRWYDLRENPAADRVTIYDDRVEAYRDEDVKRIADLSEVVGLSERGRIVELLNAA